MNFDSLYTLFQDIGENIVYMIIILLEFFTIIVIAHRATTTFIAFVRPSHVDPSTTIRLKFARSLAMAIEFQLAAEILRTLVARTIDEILMVGLYIVLRGLLTFLIHWEMDHDAKLEKLGGK